MIPSLDIIIVNWNAGNQLRDCLESIVSSKNEGFVLIRVVVVNNASSDESVKNLFAIKLPLVIIHNNENRGFSVACNQGAVSTKADYLLFLNPDTQLFEDSLIKPIRFLQEKKNNRYGIIGIRLLNSEGQTSRTCTKFPTAWGFVFSILGINRCFPRFFKSHLMLDWDHLKSMEVDHVMGSFYLVRTELFKKLGGFDERYFVYLEDLDFSLRAKQAGYGIFYLTDVVAYHKGGGTSEQVKALRLFYSLQSRILYSYKHFSWLAATFVLISTLLIEPFTRIIFAISRLSFITITETVRGYIYLWRVIPYIVVDNIKK
jgi:GT2 family glycosyltransferase